MLLARCWHLTELCTQRKVLKKCKNKYLQTQPTASKNLIPLANPIVRMCTTK